MPTSEVRKRLEPRMARGAWRLAAWSAGAQTVCSGFLTLGKLWPNNGWDAASFWIYTAWFIVSAILFLHLLRVRRNDWPFWDEEEARRADWDRRGRQL